LIIGGVTGGIKMLNADDLKKLENIRQFVKDQGMTSLGIDIIGVHGIPRIHMMFTMPVSQRNTGEKVSSEDPPQS
jgi:hypothetical protein